MIHALKTTPNYFEDVINGKKTFEVRRNDRAFQVGDYAALNEYDPNTPPPERDRHTRRSALFCISYVLDSHEYCKEGYVVLGLVPCSVVAGEPEPLTVLCGEIQEDAV